MDQKTLAQQLKREAADVQRLLAGLRASGRVVALSGEHFMASEVEQPVDRGAPQGGHLVRGAPAPQPHGRARPAQRGVDRQEPAAGPAGGP
ncbi:MAG: hypothetical protein R3F17_00880 [Planctomycetota bacterium]